MKLLLVALLAMTAGCTALELRTLEGGKPGYVALRNGDSDDAVLYCSDPDSGVVTCKEVWRRR